MSAPTAFATTVRLPDNGYLRPLVDLLPGYSEAVGLAAQADEALQSLPPAPRVDPAIDPQNSGHITQQWLDAVLDNEAATERHQKQRQMILHVKQRALGSAKSVLTGHVNWILRGLNDKLTALLAEVADVDRNLDGASTPAQAIGRGVTEHWKRLSDLADDYSTLRSAQDWIMANLAQQTYSRTCRPDLGGPDHANLSWLRGLNDIYPSWKNPGLGARFNVDGSKDRTEPWPADHGPELLLWLVRTPAAQPWVASCPQIDELFQEIRDRDNPQQPQDFGRQTLNEAPRDYYSRIAAPLEAASNPTPVELDDLTEAGADT